MGIMKAFFKSLLKHWKAFAAKLAIVQTTIILFIVYFGVFSIISLIAFLTRQDLLDKSMVKVDSYWKTKQHPAHNDRQYTHQF